MRACLRINSNVTGNDSSVDFREHRVLVFQGHFINSRLVA
jgi:hypothetical protein